MRRVTPRTGYPHELWTRLRAESPVARIEPDGYEPFWAITKHADILEVAKQPVRFSSAQGITLRRAGMRIPPSELVVMLDPPRHGPVRRVANPGFTPRAVRARRARDRAHRGRDPRRGDAGRVGGRLRLRRADRRALPARRDRFRARRSARRLAPVAAMDQRGHRQGGSGVPTARRDARPDRQRARVVRCTRISGD